MRTSQTCSCFHGAYGPFEGEEPVTLGLGREGRGRLQWADLITMAVLERQLHASLRTSHFIDIIALNATRKEKCDLSFPGEEAEPGVRKVILTQGCCISNSGPFWLSLKLDLVEGPHSSPSEGLADPLVLLGLSPCGARFQGYPSPPEKPSRPSVPKYPCRSVLLHHGAFPGSSFCRECPPLPCFPSPPPHITHSDSQRACL